MCQGVVLVWATGRPQEAILVSSALFARPRPISDLPHLSTRRVTFWMLEGVPKLFKFNITHSKQTPLLPPSRNGTLDLAKNFLGASIGNSKIPDHRHKVFDHGRRPHLCRDP